MRIEKPHCVYSQVRHFIDNVWSHSVLSLLFLFLQVSPPKPVSCSWRTGRPPSRRQYGSFASREPRCSISTNSATSSLPACWRRPKSLRWTLRGTRAATRRSWCGPDQPSGCSWTLSASRHVKVLDPWVTGDHTSGQQACSKNSMWRPASGNQFYPTSLSHWWQLLKTWSIPLNRSISL